MGSIADHSVRLDAEEEVGAARAREASAVGGNGPCASGSSSRETAPPFLGSTSRTIIPPPVQIPRFESGFASNQPAMILGSVVPFLVHPRRRGSFDRSFNGMTRSPASASATAEASIDDGVGLRLFFPGDGPCRAVSPGSSTTWACLDVAPGRSLVFSSEDIRANLCLADDLTPGRRGCLEDWTNGNSRACSIYLVIHPEEPRPWPPIAWGLWIASGSVTARVRNAASRLEGFARSKMSRSPTL